MDWSNERYVRYYVRDTVTYATWPWEAQALMGVLMRKLDRSGVLDTGDHDPVDAVCALYPRWPREVVEAGLNAMLRTGTVRHEGDRLLMTKFQPAQEAKQTDAQRKREERARARDRNRSVTKRDTSSNDGRNVQIGTEPSQIVTPYRAVLNQPTSTEPPQTPPSGGALDAPRIAREGDRHGVETASPSQGVQIADAEHTQGVSGAIPPRRVAARRVRRRSGEMTNDERDALTRVIDHLNEMVERFDPDRRGFSVNKTNAPEILARLREGATIDELCEVLDARVWLAERESDLDKRAAEVGKLNPTTPFRRSNWAWSQGLVRRMAVSGQKPLNGQKRKVKHDDITGAPYFVDQGQRRACDEQGRLPGEEGHVG